MTTLLIAVGAFVLGVALGIFLHNVVVKDVSAEVALLRTDLNEFLEKAGLVPKA